MPDQLANLEPPDRSAATTTRSFALQMETGADLEAIAFARGDLCGDLTAMHINGSPMEMGRIDEEVRKGDTELWRISVHDQLHPFHVHGCSFRILSADGSPPPA